MIYNWLKNTVYFILLINFSCNAQQKLNSDDSDIIVGANLTETYLPLLIDKNVAIVGNQTSVIFKNDNSHVHLVDSLLNRKVNIKKVFAPEHGFRGKADAGEIVKDGIDTKTNLPIVSLYGDNKKPKPEQLLDIDLIIFDIQDVGARFYTYISTLHYIMEACAENNIELLVLDRPNPNGHYIDGPILEKKIKSFVGMHPVPIVHGLTIGEYAKMINGESWLENGIKCDLKVMQMKNYNKTKSYDLPIKPSPNLPNSKSINLYPSLCFFEGTNVNAGRGTNLQFQIFGSPFLNPDYFEFEFTPKSNPGAKYPKHENKTCYGKNLQNSETLNQINLKWLIEAYQNTENQSEFFNNFFNKLAGNDKLKIQIEARLTAKEIRATWVEGLKKYQQMILPYEIYED